jgi:single-stranded-DNA-specific exonuclease
MVPGEDRFRRFAEKIRESVASGKKILVVSHLDADGLSSGSIIFEALRRIGGNVTLRIYPELDIHVLEELKKSRYDFFILTDLGSSMIEELNSFGENFLLIDHHVIAEEHINNQYVLNAWQIGLDGGRDACSSTLSYFIAKALDHRNVDLSVLAVVGSVADRQDNGPKHSLTKLNREALKDSLEGGYVSVIEDILLPGRETRPVHESLSLLVNPYIPGITGNKDAAYSALLNAEIELKVSGVWRTPSELTKEEKSKIVEIVVSSLPPSSGFSVDQLIGEVYLIEMEDTLSPLRDAREFATLLNACGRMGRQDVGISVCLGNREECLKEALETLYEYRASINKIMQSLMLDSSRIFKKDKVALLNCRELVPDKLLGPITSIVASSPNFRDKVVIAITNSGEKELKVSGRVGDACEHKINLGYLMDKTARMFRGVGGGHSMAAGAKLPIESYESFTEAIIEKILDESKNKIENKVQQQ